MKKFILSAALLAVTGLASVKASEVKNPTMVAVQDSTTKTPVEIKDLPEAIKTTLASEPVKDWIPTAAVLVTLADKSSYYQVDVKKGEETKALKFAADGKIIE